MRIMVFWTLILKFDIVSVIELLFLSESLGYADSRLILLLLCIRQAKAFFLLLYRI